MVTGSLVIISKNPIHGVINLVITFIVTGIMLISLGKELVSLILIIVYVGGIAILFLFVVMMLNIRLIEKVESTIKYIPVGIIIGIGLIIIGLSKEKGGIGEERKGEIYEGREEIENKGKELIEELGEVLFTPSGKWEWLIVGSLILLVSMIGAIVLTLKHEKGVKRQDLYEQKRRES